METITYEKLIESISDETDSPFPIVHRPGIHKFIAANHTRARANLRHPDMKAEDWKDLHKRVENHLNSIPKSEKKNGEHLFYSKSKNIGYVAHVNHDSKTVHIMTVLPKNKSNPKPGTEKTLVETFVEIE